MDIGFGNLITLAMAAGASGKGQATGWQALVANLFPIVLMFGVMYWILLRPQQKQEKERKAMLAAIKKNDSVLTKGGILAKVVNVKGDILVVQIDSQKDVCVRVRREGVAQVIEKEKK
jgi:preprotein translocase subunit YajC